MKFLFLVSLLVLGVACASRPHKTEAVKASPVVTSRLTLTDSEIVKIDKTIAHLTAQIDEMQNLTDKMYEKSLTADPKIEKEFQRKADEYGSFDSLQANLRILRDLRSSARVATK